MSRRMKLLILAMIVLMSLGMLTASAQTPQTSNPDEAAIRAIVQQLQDGWNAHDAKAFAAPFAVDADYVIVNGVYIKTRETIEKGHAGIFSTIYKASHNVGTVKSIRFLRPDVALVHVEWNLEFRVGPDTKKAKAMNTIVMTKDKGKWSIAAFHNTPVQTEGH
ncbi:MAG: hypothetical protein QOJ64_506 [Acidobacteriota bacterium]|nr:hypothetical protein [Acidobacteriota bacterium]